MALQNLEVLRVGRWGTGPEGETADDTTGGSDLLTLLMPQQDALVLEWLLVKFQEGQAEFALVLRSQDDDEIVSTDPVTLDYMMKRFKIVVPPKTSVTTTVIEAQGSIEPN